jgi:hypothetical protein
VNQNVCTREDIDRLERTCDALIADTRRIDGRRVGVTPRTWATSPLNAADAPAPPAPDGADTRDGPAPGVRRYGVFPEPDSSPAPKPESDPRYGPAPGVRQWELEDEPAPEPSASASHADRAAAEWDADPSVRAGFSSRESFLAYRQAELAGHVRVYSGGGVVQIGTADEWLKADELKALARRVAQQST